MSRYFCLDLNISKVMIKNGNVLWIELAGETPAGQLFIYAVFQKTFQLDYTLVYETYWWVIQMSQFAWMIKTAEGESRCLDVQVRRALSDFRSISREAFIRKINHIPGCYICTMDEDYLRNSHMAAFVQLTGTSEKFCYKRQSVKSRRLLIIRKPQKSSWSWTILTRIP